MENNYFVPEKDELRIGYEYEVYSIDGAIDTVNFTFKVPIDAHKEWNKYKIYQGVDLMWAESYLNNGRLRVPYLTKEQIEKEGWIYNKHRKSYEKEISKEYWVEVRLGDNYNLSIITSHKTPESAINNPSPSFNGKCKDINTFRLICKLLEIKPNE